VGAGDTYGQAVSHGVASGMGGIRTAGDLVARMQITRGMRLAEAKEHVAGKLGVSALDLSDPTVMLDVRKQFGLGGVIESGEVTDIDDAIGLEAKFNIAALLELPLACVERFSERAGRRRRVEL
jgi:dimethylamine---corrinoid protein Co-methyltransferase